jgi:hypothetical protein
MENSWYTEENEEFKVHDRHRPYKRPRIERNKLGVRRHVVFSSFSLGKQLEEPNPTTYLYCSPSLRPVCRAAPITGMLVAS